MAPKSASLDRVSHTHDISITVHGLASDEAARQFASALFSVPVEEAHAIAFTKSEDGYTFAAPPLCCVDDWWGFVWNGVCEWRGDGCPA